MTDSAYTIQQNTVEGLGSALNGKADIDASNFNATGKTNIIGWMLPDYSAGVALTPLTTNQTITTKGWIFANTKAGINNAANTLYINDIGMLIAGSTATNNYGSVFVPVAIGDTYRVNTTTTVDLYFYPCKGV